MAPAQPIHLQPVHPPLGINPAYCAPKQTVLCMKERVMSISSDAFHINDENGYQVVQCKPVMLSMSHRKQFSDNNGNLLFTLRQKLLQFKPCFYAEDPSEKVLFEVKSKLSFGKAKMLVTFTNTSNGQPVELLLMGDWFNRSAQITMGDQVVATIGRSYFNMREIFGQQTYYVTVAPGVDLTMMAAICVCLDEKEAERKRA